MVKIVHSILMLGLVCSCSVTVKDIEAPVTLPEKFSASGQIKQPEKWWQVFNDNNLNQLCEQALTGSFSLLTAFNRLDQARAIAKKAGAELIPQVNLSTLGSGVFASSNRANDFGLGLTANYEVDLWGRIRSAVNAAELDVKAAEEDIFSAAISLTAEIATAWFNLLEQRQQLTLLDRQILINRNNVALVTVRFKGAQATAADVFQQQQLLESVIGSRYTVVASIAVLESQLSVLLSKPLGTLSLAATVNFPILPALPKTGLSLDLVQRRPDLRKAYLNVQAADQRIASAIADRLPKLSISASVEGNSPPDLQSLLNNWLATIAGNLVLPVIDGRRRAAEVERNQAVSAEALNKYAALLLNATKEVENALAQEQQQQLLVANLTRQVQLATQASELIQLRYVNGAIDFLRVLSAILSQQSLERNLLKAQVQLLEYRINLYRALAGKFPISIPNMPNLNKGVPLS